MTLAYARFLNTTGHPDAALKQFSKFTEHFGTNSNSGLKASFEICRLVVNQKVGEARIKAEVFNRLKDMQNATTNENIAEALILLGKPD
jgi:hypothetical protein